MKAKFAMIMALILVLSFSVTGFGANIIESINAKIANDMGFMVDGEKWQPKDVDGTALSPIIYKGRSYVPVRSLLEEKDVEVDFDEDTRTIILNYPEPPSDPPLTQVGPAGEPRDKPMWDHSDEDVTQEIVFAMNMGEIGGPYREWIIYDFPKNKRNADGDNWPPTKQSVSFMFDDESEIIVNGEKQSFKELLIGQDMLTMGSGTSVKVTFKDMKEAKTLASIELDGELEEPGVAQTNVVVEVVVKDGIVTINIYY